LIDEELVADMMVVATRMINFGVSTTLKSWFDYIARGRTYVRRTETWPTDLAAVKHLEAGAATRASLYVV